VAIRCPKDLEARNRPNDVLDDGVVAAIGRAPLNHLFIFFFRDQALSAERFFAFARRFA
jgi:alpha-ketoglutarate-dependent taurine dioxygenase